MTTFTHAEMQRACEREVKYRERVYPRLVDAAKMTKQKADTELALMRAMTEHFRKLAEADRLI